MYEGEEQTSTANTCKLKVAQFSAKLECYVKAIELFEAVALASLDNNLLKYSVKVCANTTSCSFESNFALIYESVNFNIYRCSYYAGDHFEYFELIHWLFSLDGQKFFDSFPVIVGQALAKLNI